MSFAALVHDFGLVSWSLARWKQLGRGGIVIMAEEAPPGWWRRSIGQFLHNGINEATMERISKVAKATPEWLLDGDHSGTYFDPRVVPRDVTGTIFGYLRGEIRTPYLADGYIIRRTFCGFQHSYRDTPAYEMHHRDNHNYHWVRLGERRRDNNLPNRIDITADEDLIIWYKTSSHLYSRCIVRLRIPLECWKKHYVIRTEDTIIAAGDDCPVEREVIGYLRGLE